MADPGDIFGSGAESDEGMAVLRIRFQTRVHI
jgi:hypothetical protein